MTRATIRARSGAVITVEGTPQEVSGVVSAYERIGTINQEKQTIARNRAVKRKEKKRDSAGDLVIRLRDGGFFDKPKSLGEISESLEEGGYLCPTTTLSGVVLGLVKKRELRRKKVEGKWVYGK